MNKDIAQGKWRQLVGRVKEEWGDLTDDEIMEAEGKRDRMIGLLQEKYGYTREKAEEAYDDFTDNLDADDM